MLKDSPLRIKLMMILLVPLLGFLALAGIFLSDNYKTLQSMDNTVAATATAGKVSRLITAVQRERGVSGVFLGSRGTNMRDDMLRMRSDSDAAVTLLQASASSEAGIQTVLQALQGLPELRGRIDQQGLSSTDSGVRYTALIRTLIDYTHALESSVDEIEVERALSALNQFIEMKERAGRERVTLGLVFNQDHFDEPLLSRFSRNLGEFEAYQEAFRRKTPSALLAEFEQTMRDPAAAEVARLQKLAFEIPLGQPLGVQPQQWFKTATQRIDLMSTFEEKLGQQVSTLARETLSDARQALWGTVLALVATLLVVFALSWFIIRNIDQAVRDVNQALNAIAGRDLTARARYQSKDEFGQISHNLNRMAVEISDVIREIGSATAQVATAAEESSAVTIQTSQSVEQQRQGTEQVATAINEMSATVREVAQSTSDAARLSQSVNGSTEESRNEIEGTITLIQQLSSQAEDTAAVINELKQGSDAISSVLDVIRGIADQTNLLALNAAIEAARAGDHGRGFAVVASEVRMLAQKTQESTGNIQQMIANLQQGSDRASASMQDTLNKAQAGATRIERAGVLLADIADGVATISDRNIQIASAAEEQSAVAEDINRNVTLINDLVIQVSAGAAQTAVTSQELARLAEQQQELVSRFKMG